MRRKHRKCTVVPSIAPGVVLSITCPSLEFLISDLSGLTQSLCNPAALRQKESVEKFARGQFPSGKYKLLLLSSMLVLLKLTKILLGFKGRRASGNTSQGQTPFCLHSSPRWSSHVWFFPQVCIEHAECLKWVDNDSVLQKLKSVKVKRQRDGDLS